MPAARASPRPRRFKPGMTVQHRIHGVGAEHRWPAKRARPKLADFREDNFLTPCTEQATSICIWFAPFASGTPGLGTITDDTQFSMWLLQSLIANGGVEPHDLVHRFTAKKIRGIGQATREFVRNVKVLGKPLFESGVASAGNGVAM